MKKPVDATEDLFSRAAGDNGFRDRLLADPRKTIQAELGVALAEGHEIHVHEETYAATHVVLPPRSKFTEAEREEARTGAASLAFLRKTLHDPAPPRRPAMPERRSAGRTAAATGALLEAARDGIRRGLAFLQAAVDENGAWRCVRFNTADPAIPRHYERPPFVSAFCALALERCGDARAKALYNAARNYLADTVEYPGLWRYYRHLPQDLDSTALCSLLAGNHPWIFLGRNVPQMLANRDEDGRFTTWILAGDEPDVVSRFRFEADPVVNANVIAYLGDRPETEGAQRWLKTLIAEGRVEGSSKWYPDEVALYYATARAMVRSKTALDELRPTLAGRVLDLRDDKGDFRTVLQAAQAVATLHNIGSLEGIDAKRQLERLVCSQREDGSWPELLAFGDQTLKWGTVGQIGHGSEAVTSAFCVEALDRLLDVFEA